jgi:drug/metabolite transporter (DMT)-like permease
MARRQHLRAGKARDPSSCGVGVDDATGPFGNKGGMTLSGEAFALLAAAFFAASGVAVAKGVARRGHQGHQGGDHGVALSILITVVLAAAVWLATPGAGAIVSAGPALYTGILWFAVSGVLTIFLGRTLLYQSIAHVGAIHSSMLLRLHPFFSLLLAGVILGEAISTTAGAGMALILLSFGLLLRRTFGTEARAPSAKHEGRPSPIHYAYGPASAFSYGLGNIARKHALAIVPDSSFGTLISALAGVVSVAVAALFMERYRSAFTGVFRNASRWQVAAGLFASAGQLAQFAAIKHIEVSRAVMISSAEIFLSMFLAVYVLKTEKRPDAMTLLAAALAMVGVVLVAAG